MLHSMVVLTNTPLLHSACKLNPYGNISVGSKNSQPHLNSQYLITNARHRKIHYHLSRDLPTCCTTTQYWQLARKYKKGDSRDSRRCLLPSTMYISRGSILLHHETHQTLLHASRDMSIDDGASKPNPPQHTPRGSGEGVGGVHDGSIYKARRKRVRTCQR